MLKTKSKKIDTGNAKANILLESLAQMMESGDALEVQNLEVVADPQAKRITIPVGMSKLTAAHELELQHNNEEQIIQVSRTFEGWNWKDALVAVKKVSEDTFGWIHGKTEYTFAGPKRPQEIDIQVDVVNGKDITEKCFFGKFEAAVWEASEVNVYFGGDAIGLQVTCKKKYSESVSEFFDLIENQLKTKSIYRGKTIVITEQSNPGGHSSIDFEIIENKSEEKIILNPKEELVVDKFILGVLGEKGKKCYLFTGDYGTGKTETAMNIGRKGVEKGMTFFYCKAANVFEKFLNLSKRYQPCIVFLEDVDEIGAGEQRDSRMNSILNTLDGVQTKGNDLTVIFTTNHEKKINKALRRPGRIDLIVRFEYPLPETKKKIYEVLLAGLSEMKGFKTLDYDKIVNNTPEVQGAVIAQICKRSVKLAEREEKVSTDTVIAAIGSMEYQIAFMKEDIEKVDDNVTLVNLLSSKMAEGVARNEQFGDMKKNIDYLRSRI